MLSTVRSFIAAVTYFFLTHVYLYVLLYVYILSLLNCLSPYVYDTYIAILDSNYFVSFSTHHLLSLSKCITA